MSLAASPRADRSDEEWDLLLTALAAGRARRALEDAVTALDIAQMHPSDELDELRRELHALLARISALTP